MTKEAEIAALMADLELDLCICVYENVLDGVHE